jgi:hypothetical protein
VCAKVLESIKGCRAVGVLIQRAVRLHRRVARRIGVPQSSGCVFRSRDWEIYQIHWIRRCIMKDRANNLHHLGIRALG